MQTTLEILKEFWQYDAFRPLQEEVINSVLAQKDTLALMPTGGGKSANYKTLAHAMTQIRHLDNFEKVNYFILNPKSILMG
jgi:ATP-dependent DNA helicase RecQ